MKATRLLLAWACFVTPAFAQEPEEPETPQTPPPAEDQEPAPVEPTPPSMEDIMDAIETVRETFVRADRAWTEARSTADEVLSGAGESSPEELGDKLDAGLSEAAQLVADMERLLEILPESDSEDQQNQQPSGGQQQNPSQDQRESQGDQRRPGEDDQNGDSLDGNQDANQPAPGDIPPDGTAPIFLAPGRGGGSWGHLPPRLQQTLQNAQAEDLPLRYRGLLEQFHKRRQQD